MAVEEIKKETPMSMCNMTLFFCNFCNECYSHLRSFKLHYRAHKKRTCDTCGKVFFLQRELTAHSRSHPKVYSCEVCNKVFNSKSLLKRHERMHNAEKSHICDVCKSTFISEVELKKHYSTHAAEGPYVCDICQACFEEKSSLQEHMFTHIAEKNNSDEVDDAVEGKIVKGTREMKNYLRNSKGIDQHKCDICEKVFKTKTLLKNHCHVHKGRKSCKRNIEERVFSELPSSTSCTVKKQHVCDICKKSFKTKILLKNHCNVHKRKKSVKGNNAERAFSELTSSISRTVDKPYVCSICKKKFKTKLLLKNHYDIHKRKKPYKGIIAERAVRKLPSSTNRTVAKLHVCDICKKNFATKTLLKNHYDVHKRKKSCKGNIAKKAFIELPRSTNRTVQKPHVCDLCQKSFSRKSSFMSHGCTAKSKT